MTFELDDTIAALASPAGSGARGTVRLSGPDVRAVIERLFQPEEVGRWKATRRAERHAGMLRITALSVPLPVAVYLWPFARSYTGQPMAELHLVGSPPLLEAVLGALFENGARPARPGEFTLRAFLAGRVDLMQAEAVLGVIDAHDHEELDLALKQLAGGISGRIAAVRNDLFSLLADLEAGLDFVEEDIEFIERRELIDRVRRARDALNELLGQASTRMLSTGRRRVVLAGLPNTGKSTLFNALAGRQAALVSHVQGTTRDYLSAELDWNALAVELVDTAGWEPIVAGTLRVPSAEASQDCSRVPGSEQRDGPAAPLPGLRKASDPATPEDDGAEAVSQDGITSHAQTLRDEQLQRADLIVWCTAADLDQTASELDAQLREQLQNHDRPLLIVQTKCDRNSDGPASGGLQVSALYGTGLPRLIEAAAAQLADSHRGGGQLLGTTAARCRESLRTAAAALDQALSAAEAAAGDEIIAFEVRAALEHLGDVLGAVYTDDLLDRIFSKFCIGK